MPTRLDVEVSFSRRFFLVLLTLALGRANENLNFFSRDTWYVRGARAYPASLAELPRDGIKSSACIS